MVPSDSKEWLAECEARAVLSMHTKSDRYRYLNKVQERRGREARDRLHAGVLRLWRVKRSEGGLSS
jgi:hypothetical protein